MEFLVRKGRFNFAKPHEVTTNVHIKIDDVYINAHFDEHDYNYYVSVFEESTDVDEIIDVIDKCCDRILRYIYNSEKPNAEQIKKIIRTDRFRKELTKLIVARINKKIEYEKSRLQELERQKVELEDILRG